MPCCQKHSVGQSAALLGHSKLHTVGWEHNLHIMIESKILNEK